MKAVGGEKGQPFKEDKPPQLSISLIELSDVSGEIKPWNPSYLPIDILLIVESDFGLSSCLSFMYQTFETCNKEVGLVYFGHMGNASYEKKLRVALMKCSKAAATPVGSSRVLIKAVEILQPKAVFFVGTCNGLSSKKVSLGDVVIPSSLTAAVGSKVFASPRLGDLAKDVTNRWVAPLQKPDALEVKVHHGGNILKQSLTVDCTYDDLHELYPEAIAVETESEGISLKAFDDIIEWVVVKGVTSYFNQTKSSTSGWMSFASTMAASIVASMLKDPVVFRQWSHYSQGYRKFSEARLRKMEERVLMSFKGSPSEVEELRMISQAKSEAMEEYAMRFQIRLRDLEERVLMSSKGSPSEVEELMTMISEARFETIRGYTMPFKARLRDLEGHVLMSSKGSPSEVEELMTMISEARLQTMREYTMAFQTIRGDLEERVLMSSKGSPSEVEELMRRISEARFETMEEYTKRFQTRLRDLEEHVLMSSKGSPSEVEGLKMISKARWEAMEEYTKRFQTRLRDLEERVLMSSKGSPSEVEEVMRMISEARFDTMEEYSMAFQTRLRDLEERVLMSSKGSPSEVEGLRMFSKARWELMEEYTMAFQTRLGDLEEFVLKARSLKFSPTEVEEWGSISEEKWGPMEASDVKEGKGDKKAIDEERKQYGGNEGKDDEGGVEADKTEIQGQVQYEQETYDDDLGAQISETMKEDLFRGIHELEVEEREELDKVTIFEGTVTSEGFHLDLNVGAIHLTFPPDTVAEPTDIMVYKWKYGACLPQLTEHEAVVSNVVEISAATVDGVLTFNSEVKLALSHSAANLEGYELVMKRLTDTEKNEWEEIVGCEDIQQVSDIKDDDPCPNNVPYSFPVVRAGIRTCSSYAVVSRLKLSPTYTITVSGGTFCHPKYPQVTITVPQNAVAPETKLSLQLQVQEVLQDKFQGCGLFCGPILRVQCSSGATFLEPVAIQLPVSLGNKLVDIPQPSKCHVRILFHSSRRESWQWVDFSDRFENPASYDGKVVKFMVQGFSLYTFLLVSTVVGASTSVIAAYTMYLSSIRWKQPLKASFFAYFHPKMRIGPLGVLCLICCPAHQRGKVKQELTDDGFTASEETSRRDMIPRYDTAFVFVSGGVYSVSRERVSLRFDGNTALRAQLQVCQRSNKKLCKVEFRDTADTTRNSYLLSALNLIFSSPSIDHQETPGTVNIRLAEASSAGVASEKEELCSPSPEDKPPQLSVKLRKASEIRESTKTWSDDYQPIDILLLTSGENSDFLSCFIFLDQPFKCYRKDIGIVYFGRIGNGSAHEKLKIALMTCSKGSAAAGGSLAVVQEAIRVLRPKGIISVGTCISLGPEDVKMGHVVIPSKLITAEGDRTPISSLFSSLARHAPNGWDPPLKNPDELEVKVHCSRDMLSQSLTEMHRCEDICAKHPEVVAIETEGTGVYAAAYDKKIEWMIVKGVAGYLHQEKSATGEWMPFASIMAASVVANMLKDPIVFLDWPHFDHEC